MTQREPASGWVVGWTIYAAVWMVILGFFHAMAGLIGIVNDKIYAVTPEYIFQFDATTWGWIHLIMGFLVLIAGFSVFNGAVWARTVGVILAVVSTVANFAWIPYYPIWGIVMIVANAFVIWALTVHGRDIAAS